MQSSVAQNTTTKTIILEHNEECNQWEKVRTSAYELRPQLANKQNSIELIIWIAFLCGFTIDLTIISNPPLESNAPPEAITRPSSLGRSIASVETYNIDSRAENADPMRMQNRELIRQGKRTFYIVECEKGDAFQCYTLAQSYKAEGLTAKHQIYLKKSCENSTSPQPSNSTACQEWAELILNAKSSS
ncbi:MAG: hypothetical protein CL677_03750 [Bdellovibrionaceae bacterium]|nr:hypothetical protein [Pseudobdellovibrionaceae bacterium]|tara:strand:- start:107323 stop:107886 length:564 start_codon:yes stop_codon:yes gene_type:complete